MDEIINFLFESRKSCILKLEVINLKTRQILPIVAIWWIATVACGMISWITVTNNLKDKSNDHNNAK